MIKNLPKSLIASATDYLINTRLFEEAYDRKKSINLVASIGQQLAEHMVMVEHAGDSIHAPHWKTEINAFFGKVHRAARLKGGKLLKHDDLYDSLIDGPLGEYDDYLLTHLHVSNAKPEVSFTKPSPESHHKLLQQYHNAFNSIINGTTPTHESITINQ